MLVVYAVLGFALLAIRRVPDSVVLALLGLCLVFPARVGRVRPAHLFSNETTMLATFEY